jgi:uncharacterized phage-associated protein
VAVRFEFSFEKFLASIQYMATAGVPELDTYKALKLLFLADKNHLVRFARPITGDCYVAMEYGPVASHSFDLLKSFTAIKRTPDSGLLASLTVNKEIFVMLDALDMDMRFKYPRFISKAAPEFSHLSKSDIMALDHVREKFGPLGFNELKSLTHSVFAYRKTWNEKGPNSWIDFEDFFEEDADAIEGAKELMLENAEVSEAFPSIDKL